MLDALCGADDCGIFDGVFVIFLHGLGAFLDQAFHAHALLARGLFAQQFEDLLQTRHMFGGLAQMVFEGLTQLFVRRGLHQLVFRVIKVPQFVDIKFS